MNHLGTVEDIALSRDRVPSELCRSLLLTRTGTRSLNSQSCRRCDCLTSVGRKDNFS
jgi:hypothetical protein